MPYEPTKKTAKEMALNSATESSCHHMSLVYLAKHLYKVARNVAMNKTIVMSGARPLISDLLSDSAHFRGGGRHFD